MKHHDFISFMIMFSLPLNGPDYSIIALCRLLIIIVAVCIIITTDITFVLRRFMITITLRTQEQCCVYMYIYIYIFFFIWFDHTVIITSVATEFHKTFADIQPCHIILIPTDNSQIMNDIIYPHLGRSL